MYPFGCVEVGLGWVGHNKIEPSRSDGSIVPYPEGGVVRNVTGRDEKVVGYKDPFAIF